MAFWARNAFLCIRTQKVALGAFFFVELAVVPQVLSQQVLLLHSYIAWVAELVALFLVRW
jgi:hypothetical protein